MHSTATSSSLDLLRTAGIITDGHRRRALADERAADLADLPDPPHQLAWLICRDIVSMEDVRLAFEHVANTCEGAELERNNGILVEALDLLDAMRLETNTEALAALAAAGLITSAEHAQLHPKLPRDTMLPSAAEMFVWIKHSGHLSGQRIKEIRYARRDDNARRNAILDDAEAILGDQRAAISAFWDQVLPGPRWLWIAAPVLIISFIVWKSTAVEAAPACDDSEVGHSLQRIMLHLDREALTNALLRNSTSSELAPKVGDIEQVGYASAFRTRGCRARISHQGKEYPYAYTIAPEHGDKKQFRVTGASNAIVEARFSRIDEGGRYLNNAAPVGRAELERVLRDAVGQLNGAGPADATLLRRAKALRLGTQAPDRLREIAEVEPLAPCRELQAGTAYRCRLLIEYNDPLQDASTALLDGEFTFQRDGADGRWMAADDFAASFGKALAAARSASVQQ